MPNSLDDKLKSMGISTFGEKPVETPPVDGAPPVIPAAEPPKDTQPTVVEPDYLKFVNETFGFKYTTLDEAKVDLPSKLKSHDELKEKFLTLEEEYKNTTDPFANEDIAKLNHFVKTTGKDVNSFLRLNGVDPGKLNPLDAIKLKYMIDDPVYVNKEGKLEELILKKAGINRKDFEKVTEDEDGIKKSSFDEAAYQNAIKDSLELDIEGKKAIKEISEIQSKMVAPEKKTVDLEAKKAERVQIQEKNMKIWNNTVSELVKSFTKLDHFQDPNQKEPYVSVDIPVTEQADMQKFLLNYIETNNIEPTEQNLGYVNNVLHDMAEKVYMKTIIQKSIDKAVSENNQVWQKRVGSDWSPNKDLPTDKLSREEKNQLVNKKILES